MHCKNSRLHDSSTAKLRRHGLVKATLAVATCVALTVTTNTTFAGSAHSFTEYAPVVRVEPIYRNVTVREPQRICRPAARHNHSHHRHNQHRHEQSRTQSRHTTHRSNRSRSHANAEVFVAGVVGGAIGRELSRSVNGRPSAGATIAGAVIGSAIASSSAKHSYRVDLPSTSTRHSRQHLTPTHNRYDQRQSSTHNHQARQHCTTTVQTRTKRKHDGFNVTYRYRGHRYQTRTRHHPGDHLAITVSVKPQTLQ